MTNHSTSRVLGRRWLRHVEILALSVGFLLVVLSFGCATSPEAKSARFLESGKRLLEKKDYPRAILQFRNALQAKPNNAEVYYQLGLAFQNSGDIPTATAALKRATELNPKHAAAQLKLSQILESTGYPQLLEDAEARLNSVLEGSPGDPDAIQALALTELKLGKSEDAVARLEETLAAFPRHLSSSVTLAWAKVEQKDYKGAEAVLKTACENAPDSAYPLLALGRLYRAMGKDAEAEQQFRRAVAIDPHSDAVLLDLAMVQRQLGRKQEAEQGFRRLADSPDRTYKSTYAMFLFEEGRPGEGIAELERLSKSNPQDRTVRTLLVRAYQVGGRSEDAEKLLNGVLKKNPNDAEALLQRSELFLAAGKDVQAEKDVGLALHYLPTSGTAHFVLSRVYRARGATLEQRQELNEALRLNPSLLTARLELSLLLLANNGAKVALDLLNATPAPYNKSLAVIVQRNWALLALGNLKEARNGIDLGLSWQRTPELLTQQGVLKVKEGDFRGAHAALEESIKLRPENLTALEALGQTYVAEKQVEAGAKRLQEIATSQPKSATVQSFFGNWLISTGGNRAEARKALEAAKAADPHSIAPDVSLADLDIVEGNTGAARERLKPILAAHPENVLVRLYVADVERREGHDAEAIQNYRKVLEADSRNVRALNNLAYYLAEEQPDEALKYAQEAKEILPDSPDVDDTLGWVFYRKGMYQSALPYLQQAVAKQTDPAIKYHLGLTYLRLGNQKKGQELLAIALKAAPNAPEAKLARDLMGPQSSAK